MRKSRSLQVMTATALCAVGLLLVSVVGGQAATAPKITRVSPLAGGFERWKELGYPLARIST